MSFFSFNTTKNIHNEFGSARHISAILKRYFGEYQFKHILFVTDPGIMSLGLADQALESLSVVEATVSVYDEIVADPPESIILKGVDMAKSNEVDLVIGFGGGSSMDAAKLISYLSVSNKELNDIYGVGLATGERLPLVLVPTTAGTGSEVTGISIVTTGTQEKKGVVSPILLPDIAVLDAELTLGLPAAITAATGIDAMVHAIEAYTSINVNNNPISQTLAKKALSLLVSNIEEAVFNGSNKIARENMLLGSLLAGQAFANSPVAAVHALAYPIGAIFHVPHGLSNALVLPHVMKFNLSKCAKRYSDLYIAAFPDMKISDSVIENSNYLIERLSALPKHLGLQTRLNEVGISEDDLTKLAQDAMRQTRLLVNNPREVTYHHAREIYEAAL